MEDILFSIIILIISVVAHEMAHGYAADVLGDPTPRNQGRLSLNPMKHLDPIGSFILPFLTYNLGGVIFGWAKPVEFNPYNLKNPKRDEMIIAIAGPLTNLLIAVVFGLIIRFAGDVGLSLNMMKLAATVTGVNLALMVFNLIPIPPLDGSKIVLNLVPDTFYALKQMYIQYSLILFILVIILGAGILGPVVRLLFTFITGYHLSI